MQPASQLLERYEAGISSVIFNRAMQHVGFMTRKTLELPGASVRTYIVLQDDGLLYGVNARYAGHPLTTHPLYFVERFPELLERIQPGIAQEQQAALAKCSGCDASRMSTRQRQAYEASGERDRRKAEKREALRERKRQELKTMAANGMSWGDARKATNADRCFTAEERELLRVSLFRGKPRGLVPLRVITSFADLKSPEELAEFRARQNYQPTSREDARAFLIKEAKRFVEIGDSWYDFCFHYCRHFAMAFTDAEVESLQAAYERVFPTGEPLEWEGLTH